jgi:uncharacterized protein
MIQVTVDAEGVLLPIKATPNAKKPGVLPFNAGDTALKLKVSAPPEDGKANAALCEALAKLVGYRANQIQVVSGQTHRKKVLRVVTSDAEATLERLALVLGTVSALCFVIRNA